MARRDRGPRTRPVEKVLHANAPNRSASSGVHAWQGMGSVEKQPRPPGASEDEPKPEVGEEAEAGGPAAGR